MTYLILTDNSPVSRIILLVTIVFSIISLRQRRWYFKCIMHPYNVFRKHEYYRVLSCGLVHNDPVHLLINGVMLFFIGGQLEQFLNVQSQYGGLLFLIIYLTSHISGVLPVMILNRNDAGYATAGASGGILGCMMSFMILAPKVTAFYLPVIGGIANQYAALLLIIGLIVYKWRASNELLDNELHFYSALGGIITTLLLQWTVL